ncbi:hypothetical protein DL546_000632 [Coniochaeta pulveracea]|uniref:Cupin 2 conserved barrel domain-containing protein n=1 Tax=Coniochaeta pulveracea TaxID=177199 RepID=A0A420XXF2_9PEZI|nr:hypothetical protein DL546_000632 [Coniochaeta pulveracea]
MASPLPPPRRIVASNLALQSSGADSFNEPAVELLDETITRTPVFDGLERAAVFTHASVPTNNDGSGPFVLDKAPGAGVVLPGGANVYYLDLAPDLASPMHRTVSTDYCVILAGEPTYITPAVPFNVVNGKGDYEKTQETLCKAGDVVIQRGEMHSWANRTDEWVRIFCVILAANPSQTPTGDGKLTEPLGERWLS